MSRNGSVASNLEDRLLWVEESHEEFKTEIGELRQDVLELKTEVRLLGQQSQSSTQAVMDKLEIYLQQLAKRDDELSKVEAKAQEHDKFLDRIAQDKARNDKFKALLIGTLSSIATLAAKYLMEALSK